MELWLWKNENNIKYTNINQKSFHLYTMKASLSLKSPEDVM